MGQFDQLFKAEMAKCSPKELEFNHLDPFDSKKHTKIADLPDDLKRMWLVWQRWMREKAAFKRKNDPQKREELLEALIDAANSIFFAELFLQYKLQGTRHALQVVRGGALVRFGAEPGLLDTTVDEE